MRGKNMLKGRAAPVPIHPGSPWDGCPPKTGQEIWCVVVEPILHEAGVGEGSHK